METFGLSENNFLAIQKIFSNHKTIDEVIIYGSRAKGNFNSRSDIDLAVKSQTIDRFELNQIALEIDDSEIIHTVDLQNFSKLKNQKLIEHINRAGKQFYSKNS